MNELLPLRWGPIQASLQASLWWMLPGGNQWDENSVKRNKSLHQKEYVYPAATTTSKCLPPQKIFLTWPHIYRPQEFKSSWRDDLPSISPFMKNCFTFPNTILNYLECMPLLSLKVYCVERKRLQLWVKKW